MAADQIPDDLRADLEAEARKFFGHNEANHGANDWIAGLVAALAPHIAEAIHTYGEGGPADVTAPAADARRAVLAEAVASCP